MLPQFLKSFIGQKSSPGPIAAAEPTRSDPILTQFTRLPLIIPELQSADQLGAIRELSERLFQEGCIPDLERFYRSVMKRELVGNTELEAGMAFPHARLPELKELFFALGRSTTPIAWGQVSSSSVQLVFLMAVPANDSLQHLQILSGLARLSADPMRMQALLNAGDAQQMLDALQAKPPCHSSKVAVTN